MIRLPLAQSVLLALLLPAFASGADAGADGTAVDPNDAAPARAVAPKAPATTQQEVDDAQARAALAEENTRLAAAIADAEERNAIALQAQAAAAIRQQNALKDQAAAREKLIMNRADTEKAAREGSQADASALTAVSIKAAQECTIVTTNIMSAFIPFANNKRTLGLSVSSSLLVHAETVEDYLDVQLLRPEGGVANIYFTPLFIPFTEGRTFGDLPTFKDTGLSGWGGRRFAVDRLGNDFDKPGLQLYFPVGIGARIIKQNLTSDEYDLGVMGSGYIGLGLDGPIWNVSDEGTVNGQGGIDLSVVLIGGASNPHLFEEIYGVEKADPAFAAIGVRANFYIVDGFSLDLEYYGPIGGRARQLMDETFAFSLSYMR